MGSCDPTTEQSTSPHTFLWLSLLSDFDGMSI